MIFHPCRYKKASPFMDNDYVVGLAATREVGGAPDFLIDVMGNKEDPADIIDVKLDNDYIDTDKYI